MAKKNNHFMRDAVIKTCVRKVPNLPETIAEEVFNIPFKNMVLYPTEFPPMSIDGKTNIPDVLFQLENGGFLDIEAHNGPFTIEESGQTQLYAHRLGVDSAKKGQGFKLPPIYLMMLINDESRVYDRLISEEVNFKQGSNEFLGNHVHIRFVYLPYTKQLMKEKGIQGMSVGELLFYIFTYGIPENIHERKEQVIIDMISFGARFFNRRKGSLFSAREYEEMMMQKQIAKEERYRKAIENEAILAAQMKKVEATKQEVEATKQKVEATKQEVEATKQEVEATKQEVEAQKLENERKEKEMKEREFELAQREKKLKLLEQLLI